MIGRALVLLAVTLTACAMLSNQGRSTASTCTADGYVVRGGACVPWQVGVQRIADAGIDAR